MKFHLSKTCLRTTLITFTLGLLDKSYSGFVFADSIVLNDKKINELINIYGSSAGNWLKNWPALIQQNTNRTINEKLEVVNRFFNKLEFVSDQEHWNKKTIGQPR